MVLSSTAYAAIATVAILVAYELGCAWAERRSPERLARSAHATMREEWFRAVTAEPGSAIIVVQALRNSLMSATATASTAALGLVGTVTLSAGDLRAAVGEESAAALSGLTPRLGLELVLITLLVASLISSVMAVRFFGHAGFIGSMPLGSDARARWLPVGVRYVRRAGIFYSWGLRHLVVVAPILASMLHPAAGPVAALIVVTVLLRLDRVAAHAPP